MILCSGENLIDFVPIDNNSYSFKTCVGGSPLNTAIGLGSLNTPVYFFSRISTDFFGKNIINFLKKHKVKTSLIQRTADKTTIVFISNKKILNFLFIQIRLQIEIYQIIHFINQLKKKLH